MILKIIILVALIRLLIATNKPLLCAGMYTGVAVIFTLISASYSEMTFVNFLVSFVVLSAVRFVLSAIYFILLDKIGQGFLWWLVLVLGIAIGLV